ncbi:MAG: methyltransferase [Chloroflexi bacterium]|nr:methyltransferase [Chloroflexota bacterium]
MHHASRITHLIFSYFWRAFLWLRFQLFQKHKLNKPVLEWVAGKPLVILPQVFNPNLFLTSEFMVQALNEMLVPADSRFLDMGTGSGVGAVFAAAFTPHVTAIDINPAAARSARLNALLNQVEDRVQVFEGDLFAPVAGQQFDVILFNPPYYRGQPKNMLDKAFRAEDVVERFAAALPHHLTPTGHLLLLLSTTTDEESFLRLFRQQGYTITTAAQHHLPGERITLYRVGF